MASPMAMDPKLLLTAFRSPFDCKMQLLCHLRSVNWLLLTIFLYLQIYLLLHVMFVILYQSSLLPDYTTLSQLTLSYFNGKQVNSLTLPDYTTLSQLTLSYLIGKQVNSLTPTNCSIKSLRSNSGVKVINKF